MKFDNHETDLYILPENETEKEKITSYLRNRNYCFYIQKSNVKGQEWFGKSFIDVPFMKHLKKDIINLIKT